MSMLGKRNGIAICAMIAFGTGALWATLAVAKKGRDDAKTEVGGELDDRSRHGRGNGDSGSGSSTSGNGSGRSGEKSGYDREGDKNTPATNGNGTGGATSSTTVSESAGTIVVRVRRDELDRF